jgi:hypothetical protein
MFGGNEMIRVKNVSGKFIKFQGATIAPNDHFDYAKIYDYVTYTRFMNSGKISCFEVEAPVAVVADKKPETVVKSEKVETVVEKVEKETKESTSLFNIPEKTKEVTEDVTTSDETTDDSQTDTKSGRGRRRKS